MRNPVPFTRTSQELSYLARSLNRSAVLGIMVRADAVRLPYFNWSAWRYMHMRKFVCDGDDISPSL